MAISKTTTMLLLLIIAAIRETEQFEKGVNMDKMIDDALIKKASRLATLKLKDDRNDFDIPMVASGYAKTSGCVLKGLQSARRKGKATWATVNGNQQVTILLWVGTMTITGSYVVQTDQTNRVNLKGRATSAEIKIVLLSKPNAKKGCCSSVKLTKMTGFDIEVDAGEALSSMLINSILESSKEHYEPTVKGEIEKEMTTIIKEELKAANIIA